MKLKFQEDRKIIVKGRKRSPSPRPSPPGEGEGATRHSVGTPHSALRTPHSLRAFTMVEIALALAIIGFALVAIIGVLPAGLSVQKDNREQTVINLDAAYLMDAIRGGALGQDDLANYIIAITNTYTFVSLPGNVSQPPAVVWFTRTNTSVNGMLYSYSMLTNGANIVGLLSTPKYVPTPGATPGYYVDTVSADFRAINGPAMDQGLSQTSLDFAFRYRVNIEIVPVSDYPYVVSNTASRINVASPNYITTVDGPNPTVDSQTAKNLQANLYEIRLGFPLAGVAQWPGGRRPSGVPQPGRQRHQHHQYWQRRQSLVLQPAKLRRAAMTMRTNRTFMVAKRRGDISQGRSPWWDAKTSSLSRRDGGLFGVPSRMRDGTTNGHSQAALSLIEIMVAVALLAVIILGLVAMFDQTRKAFTLGLTTAITRTRAAWSWTCSAANCSR